MKFDIFTKLMCGFDFFTSLFEHPVRMNIDTTNSIFSLFKLFHFVSSSFLFILAFSSYVQLFLCIGINQIIFHWMYQQSSANSNKCAKSPQQNDFWYQISILTRYLEEFVWSLWNARHKNLFTLNIGFFLVGISSIEASTWDSKNCEM